jgi:hypothetical protein
LGSVKEKLKLPHVGFFSEACTNPKYPVWGITRLLSSPDDYVEVRKVMQTWVIQENNFNGNVQLSSMPRHNFYSYSLWHATTGEHLFDGAAGDLNEAIDTMRAHIQYLSEGRGLRRGE